MLKASTQGAEPGRPGKADHCGRLGHNYMCAVYTVQQCHVPRASSEHRVVLAHTCRVAIVSTVQYRRVLLCVLARVALCYHLYLLDIYY